jgi:hypothetical protein
MSLGRAAPRRGDLRCREGHRARCPPARPAAAGHIGEHQRAARLRAHCAGSASRRRAALGAHHVACGRRDRCTPPARSGAAPAAIGSTPWHGPVARGPKPPDRSLLSSGQVTFPTDAAASRSRAPHPAFVMSQMWPCGYGREGCPTTARTSDIARINRCHPMRSEDYRRPFPLSPNRRGQTSARRCRFVAAPGPRVLRNRPFPQGRPETPVHLWRTAARPGLPMGRRRGARQLRF